MEPRSRLSTARRIAAVVMLLAVPSGSVLAQDATAPASNEEVFLGLGEPLEDIRGLGDPASPPVETPVGDGRPVLGPSAYGLAVDNPSQLSNDIGLGPVLGVLGSPMSRHGKGF